jgi:hypothetical protein
MSRQFGNFLFFYWNRDAYILVGIAGCQHYDGEIEKCLTIPG